MSESERGDQLSGGGEEDGDDVSSLRRRRRLSSEVLGSASSSPSPPATPSSVSSFVSMSEAMDVESAACEEAASACSATKKEGKKHI